MVSHIVLKYIYIYLYIMNTSILQLCLIVPVCILFAVLMGLNEFFFPRFGNRFCPQSSKFGLVCDCKLTQKLSSEVAGN